MLKPSFGYRFSTLSNWLNITLSKNAQETDPYIWRPPGRAYIYFIQLSTFIMQNQHIHSIRSCASCRVDMGKDEFNSYTAKGFFTIL